MSGHLRVWSDVFGMGKIERAGEAAEFWTERFTDDNGFSIELKVIMMGQGPPRFLSPRVRGAPKGEDKEWISFRIVGGSTLTFRFGGPPAKEAV